ncbi:MAG TPA: single-stranded DNA-binding protein [Patescibacteria group bacterium]|nr:single-stranded DNA-binding protein [Patescibacteria group bacterium]
MSSRSLNMVQLIGNLTRDPELRFTPNGSAVCTIGLATNRSWTTQDGGGQRQEETTYHRIVVWGKLAEICGQLLKKGAKAYVAGRLQNRKWTNKEGQEKETTEIVADNVLVLSPLGPRENSESAAPSDSAQYNYPEENQTPAQVPQGAEDVSEDIPF